MVESNAASALHRHTTQIRLDEFLRSTSGWMLDRRHWTKGLVEKKWWAGGTLHANKQASLDGFWRL